MRPFILSIPNRIFRRTIHLPRKLGVFFFLAKRKKDNPNPGARTHCFPGMPWMYLVTTPGNSPGFPVKL